MERHTTDLVSLVFGLLFTAVAVIGLTDVFRITGADARWAGPGLLVLIGVLLVLTAGRSRARTGNGRADTSDGEETRHDAGEGDAEGEPAGAGVPSEDATSNDGDDTSSPGADQDR